MKGCLVGTFGDKRGWCESPHEMHLSTDLQLGAGEVSVCGTTFPSSMFVMRERKQDAFPSKKNFLALLKPLPAPLK
jgi:hypothetical protein